MFERLKIRPDEIKTLGDLRRLPLLSAQDVRENLYFDLFADNHRKRDMQKVTTVRPGGDPLEIYVDRIQLEMQLAGSLRARGRAGQPSVGNGGGGVGRERAWIACDCEACDGHHVAAESYIVEVLEDGKPAPPGEEGDVVITDLNSFSVPLIRYQVGDRAVAIDDTACACGRGLPRIGRGSRPAAGRGEGTMTGITTSEVYDEQWTELGDFIRYNPGARHRRRLVARMLRTIEFESVLDVGCGPGEMMLWLRQAFPQARTVWGADFARDTIARNRERLPWAHFQPLDIERERIDREFNPCCAARWWNTCTTARRRFRTSPPW